jgi:hypothetical protein
MGSVLQNSSLLRRVRVKTICSDDWMAQESNKMTQTTERALIRDGIGFCPCEFVFFVTHGTKSILISVFPSLFTAGTLTGFDASGHIAEETKHAQ